MTADEVAALRERMKAIGRYFAERAQEHESAQDSRRAYDIVAALALIARLEEERERAWRAGVEAMRAEIERGLERDGMMKASFHARQIPRPGGE